ncbi:hypothetical protein [Lactiplantibacillus herbarum]|uniref:hypothetical protein n=1 Tax=Lactiplantibacillus herbarum TaxID=1670446 RepID=UPI00064E3EDE|nr:hypothetical protein [Lactiplantibacillus herbarum]
MHLLIIGIITIVIAVLEEYVFSASRHFWIGGIVPILWTVVLAYLVIVNAMDLNVRDYTVAIIAVIVPYVCWGNGSQRHADRRHS